MLNFFVYDPDIFCRLHLKILGGENKTKAMNSHGLEMNF